MLHRDRYSLVNLSLGKKLLASAGLMTGVVLFYLTVFLGVSLTDWSFTLGDLLGWGDALSALRARSVGIWLELLGVHMIALTIVAALGGKLFTRLTMPRGARLALGVLVVGLPSAHDLPRPVTDRSRSDA